jgi:hypothetical protein
MRLAGSSPDCYISITNLLIVQCSDIRSINVESFCGHARYRFCSFRRGRAKRVDGGFERVGFVLRGRVGGFSDDAQRRGENEVHSLILAA